MKELRTGDNKTLNSKLDWQKEYDKNNMKLTSIKHSTAERKQWEEIAKKNGLKLATFTRACVNYCIENNIDLSAYKKD